jgi:hypothetical protein
MLNEALDEADGGARACLEAIERLVNTFQFYCVLRVCVCARVCVLLNEFKFDVGSDWRRVE